MIDSRIEILHLSDLHLGANAEAAADFMVNLGLPQEERQRAVDSLWEALDSAPSTPDCVVISGDITIRGQPDGHEIFRRQMNAYCSKAHLNVKNVVVVPGNHDVTWEIRGQLKPAERSASFSNAASEFTRPFLVGIDDTPESLGRVHYYFNIEKGLLVYPLDSSQLCGKRAVLPPADDAALGVLSQIAQSPEARSALERVQLQATLSDAPYVGARQLRRMEADVSALRSRYPKLAFEKVVKVAVLHHHLRAIPNAPIEITPFESLIDSAYVTETLRRLGFHVVLHGHKHFRHVHEIKEGAPVPLVVASGTTVGGRPATGSTVGFNWITIEAEVSNQRQATIRSLPLLPPHSIDSAGVWTQEGHVEQAILRMLPAATPRQSTLIPVAEQIEAVLHDDPDGVQSLSQALAGVKSRSDLNATVGRLSTRPIGEFPSFLPNITRMIRSAETQLRTGLIRGRAGSAG